MKKFELLGKNVASSKNSKRIVRNHLINSELVMKYYDYVLPLLEEMKPAIMAEIENKPLPLYFHFFYIRKDHRHWDFANMVQVLADAFQKVGILEDDDVDHFIPVFDGYTVNKDNPGVIFYIEPSDDKF